MPKTNKKNKAIILTFLFALVLALGITIYQVSHSALTGTPSVEITASNYDQPGSWKIDKSARWTELNKAEIKFDLSTIAKTSSNNMDVLFVLDISGSMNGDKLNKVKSDAKELTESILSNNNNKIGLVTFHSNSLIVERLTNNKTTILNQIDALTTTGCTNYNAAYKNILTALEGYQKQDNRDLLVLFLTDGYPNEDVRNQIGTYQEIKDKYPYITINGIQYEMGNTVKEDIIKVTDNQFIADMETLNNVLFEASVTSDIYDKFIIEDYIDSKFKVNSVDDIKVSIGTVILTNENGLQKITWDLGDTFKTGQSANMTIKADLKEQYHNTNGLYPTNDHEVVKTKLPEENEKTENSNKTPTLPKEKYQVIYDANNPSGCSATGFNEEYYPMEKVDITDTTLTCNGWVFKEWKIVDTTDIKDITNTSFTMPEKNVTLRAKWGRPSISKSMDGTVHTVKTLYSIIQKEAENGTLAKKYSGIVEDSLDMPKNSEDVYYYIGNPNNHVLFGDICWHMVRTTSTGGVKMIYNGKYTEDNKCNNSADEQQIGTTQFNSSSASPAYIGYMYNQDTAKRYNRGNVTAGEVLYGNGITYSNGMYTLTDTSATLDENHHYTCGYPRETCPRVRYYYNKFVEFYDYVESAVYFSFIELNGEENIEEVLENMLWADDVNTTDSLIKIAVDDWYQDNMIQFTQYLEDIVYCNDRSLANTGDFTYDNSGWNPNGGRIVYGDAPFDYKESVLLNFNHSYNSSNGNLVCQNITDKFTTTNTKAHLTYPIGLLTSPEVYLAHEGQPDNATYSNSYLKTGNQYWLLSPSRFRHNNIIDQRNIGPTGQLTDASVNSTFGVRPVISLKPGTTYTGGTGTMDDPYVVE